MEKDNNGLDTNMDIINTDDRGGPVAVVAEGAPMGPSMISTLGAASSMPPIGNMSVYKSKLHYGPKIVSVSVTNNEVVKEVSCWEYLRTVARNSSRAERVACGVALCSLLVSIIMIICFVVVTKHVGNPSEPDNAPWNISREQWRSKHVDPDICNTTERFNPIRLVIINHSEGNECHNFINCAAEMRNLQRYFQSREGYIDLPYNFVIGNDGRVYEGRGWGLAGAHSGRLNACSLGIGFLGDYRVETSNTQVTEEQVARTLALLDYGVSHGHLDPDYVVVGAKDLKKSSSPGSNLYEIITQWKHYDRNRYRNMTCAEIHTLVITTTVSSIH